MQHGARPERSDAAVGARFVLAAAWIVSYGALCEEIFVRYEVGDYLTLGKGADAVRLITLDHAAHVVGLIFDGAEHRAVADRTVGAEEHHIIGMSAVARPK